MYDAIRTLYHWPDTSKAYICGLMHACAVHLIVTSINTNYTCTSPQQVDALHFLRWIGEVVTKTTTAPRIDIIFMDNLILPYVVPDL